MAVFFFFFSFIVILEVEEKGMKKDDLKAIFKRTV